MNFLSYKLLEKQDFYNFQLLHGAFIYQRSEHGALDQLKNQES
jgi:hypothetical protein